MLSRQYSLVLFASTLIVALTNETGAAFTIIPSNPSDVEFYREQSFAQVSPNRDAITVIDKSLWYNPLRRGGTLSFNTALNLWSLGSQQGLFGWEFQRAKNDLKGSFEILTYQACNLGDGCGGASTPIEDIGTGVFRGVGSLFHLKYHPEEGDPQPGQGKLHWIQVVQANYGRGNPGVPFVYGIPFVDNGGRKDTPYYDYPGYRFAGEDFFMDRAYAAGINNARRNTYFTAQLFLVEETTLPGSQKRTATIYNGIRWGWKNKVSRRSCPAKSLSKNCSPPPPPVCTGGSGGGGCNKTTATNYVNYQDEISPFDLDNVNDLEYNYLSFLDFNEIAWNSDKEDYWYDDNEYADWNEDNSESPTSVPESTSTLGLLLLSAFVFIKSLTITKD
ncbi:MAG: hypothetical protein RLZZ507_3663 [Cyanobacteriota bacterium]